MYTCTRMLDHESGCHWRVPCRLKGEGCAERKLVISCQQHRILSKCALVQIETEPTRGIGVRECTALSDNTSYYPPPPAEEPHSQSTNSKCRQDTRKTNIHSYSNTDEIPDKQTQPRWDKTYSATSMKWISYVPQPNAGAQVACLQHAVAGVSITKTATTTKEPPRLWK